MEAGFNDVTLNDDESSRASIAIMFITHCFFNINADKYKEYFDHYRSVYQKRCINGKKHSEKECERIVDNGIVIFCKQMTGYASCDTFKELILPTTTTAPTTAAPFPIIHTIGGAAGGFVLCFILFILFLCYKKRKNAKKAQMPGSTTGGVTGTGTMASGYTGTGMTTGRTRSIA